MFSAFEQMIARRYLRSRRRTGALSSNILVSLGGVFLGVAALVIVLSVHNGFRLLIQDRFVEFDNHLQVLSEDRDGLADFDAVARRIRSVSGVTAASPFVQGKAVMQSATDQMPIILKGVDGSDAQTRARLERQLVFGSADIFGERNGLPQVVIGQNMADQLVALVGDTVTVIGSRVKGGISALPPFRRFVIAGYFSIGLGDYDQRYAVTSLAAARALFELDDRATGVEVRVEDLAQLATVAGRIREAAPADLVTRTWYELHRSLFQSMELERWATIMLLGLIVLVASFNIASSQIMLVLEKRREVGILMAMGATPQNILRIFLYQGGLIAFCGTAAGAAVGFVVCWVQMRYALIKLPADVYVIEDLPVAVQSSDFLLVSAIAVVLCLLATLYPARKAAGLNPVEAIRYE